MTGIRDEFLSEGDLDLQSLTDEEVELWWNAWLEQAQATNADDKHLYSHGVFTAEPPWGKEQSGGAACHRRKGERRARS